MYMYVNIYHIESQSNPLKFCDVIFLAVFILKSNQERKGNLGRRRTKTVQAQKEILPKEPVFAEDTQGAH